MADAWAGRVPCGHPHSDLPLLRTSLPLTDAAMTFDALTPGTMVTGLSASGPVEILAVDMHGATAATVTWTDREGRPDRRVIYGDVLASLRVEQEARRWAFTAAGNDFLLASEARRMRLAYLFDPM